MKTVFINCSPKKRFCASQYFLFLQRLFTGGKKVSEKLRNQADHARILDQLKDAQAVVLCLPLYVDAIPSHVLQFMEEMKSSADRTVFTSTFTASRTTASLRGARTSLLCRSWRTSAAAQV